MPDPIPFAFTPGETFKPEEVFEAALRSAPGIILAFASSAATERVRSLLYAARKRDQARYDRLFERAVLDGRSPPAVCTSPWEDLTISRKSPTMLWIGRRTYANLDIVAAKALGWQEK